MNKISVKGILLGAISAYIISRISGLPILLYITSNIGTPPKSAWGLVHFDKILLAETAVNLASVIIGGYVAAFVAKKNELLNGALSSFLTFGLGMFIWFNSYPLTNGRNWWLLALVMYPFFAFFGGYLRLKQTGKEQTCRVRS